MKKNVLKMTVLSSLLASTFAMAATDGSINTTSTGTVRVQVSKGSVVQITGLSDLSLGNFTDASLLAANGATVFDTACVFSSVGTYEATLTSSNGGNGTGLYKMTNAAGDAVDYTPTFNNDVATGAAQGPYNGNATDPTCAGYTLDNARIEASINSTALTGVADGNYTDVLTILIAPL